MKAEPYRWQIEFVPDCEHAGADDHTQEFTGTYEQSVRYAEEHIPFECREIVHHRLGRAGVPK